MPLPPYTDPVHRTPRKEFAALGCACALAAAGCNQVGPSYQDPTPEARLGAIAGGRAEIASGLSEGESVVLRAGAFLRDGDAVREVRQAPGAEAR